MFWIVLLLLVAGFAAGNAVGWSRHRRGLPRWPVRVGTDGIHRQPLVWFALVASALRLTACSDRAAPWAQPDTTVTAPRDSGDRHEGGDHDRDHDRGKKHKHHEDGK